MLIIVEGADGAGKTTFVNHLFNRAPHAEVRHCGPPQSHPLEEWERSLDGYRPGARRTVICDRWHPGELVYGPLLRGECLLTPEAQRHIELYLRSRGALVVWLDPELDECLRRFRRRGVDALGLTEAQVRSALLAYRSEMLTVTDGLVMRNPTVDDALRTGLRLEREVAPLAPFTTYVGPRQPEALLLGERHAERNHGFEAAFVPYPTTSGAYLLRCLSDLTLTYGVANACQEPVKDLWDALNRPVVVALGHVAEAAVDAAGVPCGAAPHPQYWRRFKHHEPEGYVDRLLSALDGEKNYT